MKPASFRRGFVLAALSLPACLPAAAQDAKPPAEPAPAVSDAGLHVRIGAMFRKGMTALAASRRARTEEEREARLDEAIAIFHAILVRRPGLPRVHLEIARAFFLKREDSLARRHFDIVLAGKPPPPVVANIQTFLDIMRQRRAWTAYFGMALAPDSNVNAASTERTILLDTPFGRLPFTRGDETAPKSGIGISVWGGGEYQYPLGDPGTGSGASRWRLRAGANASRREYRGGEFDRMNLSAHLGPRWLVGRTTEFSLLATAGREWNAGEPRSDRQGLRLETVHRPDRRLQLRGSYDWSKRDCRGCDWLDGPVHTASFDSFWALMPILRADIGANWQRTRADVESWRSTAFGAYVGATLSLPWGFTVGARATIRRTDYEGAGFAHLTIDREPRADRDRTLTASVFNRAITVAGFSPRIAVNQHRRRTNAQALGYKRLSGELSFVRQF